MDSRLNPPTALNVFALQFDVNTPQFLKEVCENCNGGMYAVCWNIFRNLLAMVSVRAAELNDPIMNVLMLRLNLYELPEDYKKPLEERISGNPRLRNELIKKIREDVEDGQGVS